MKPYLEKIEPVFGSSFTLRQFVKNGPSEKSHWHFHPEYEIVYISGGRGKRHIANHISYFESGDLIFLGPDLPHFGFTEEVHQAHEEIVLQMKKDFLGDAFFARPEMEAIRRLFERSRQGISFYGRTRREVGKKLSKMINLPPFDRLLLLLEVLQQLAVTREYELLQADGFALEVTAEHFDRMRRVYGYVSKHFQEAIRIPEVAGLVNIAEPSFCRYFKKLTGKTFTHFVNEFRVAHACQLLASGDLTIGAVSFESGFNNLSHFNKKFREITGKTPREYRREKQLVVERNTAGGDGA